MTAETWTARAKLPSFYVLQFELYDAVTRQSTTFAIVSPRRHRPPLL